MADFKGIEGWYMCRCNRYIPYAPYTCLKCESLFCHLCDGLTESMRFAHNEWPCPFCQPNKDEPTCDEDLKNHIEFFQHHARWPTTQEVNKFPEHGTSPR